MVVTISAKMSISGSFFRKYHNRASCFACVRCLSLIVFHLYSVLAFIPIASAISFTLLGESVSAVKSNNSISVFSHMKTTSSLKKVVTVTKSQIFSFLWSNLFLFQIIRFQHDQRHDAIIYLSVHSLNNWFPMPVYPMLPIYLLLSVQKSTCNHLLHGV